ncbi:carbohydrate ABC transporter permease [Paenibacillus sp. JDR-2]|uniref:carbohydrate ABC transporter permease n=1 Tax=Paenibacillus sp. (strain JDR-2) TaxID=324057 RepID=UPI000166A2E1|nr:carbohydrate ABC transporter permease [Paenibacillus sp. JDR-2]ACT00334.1 binding-protein-dependent transport systems inner membrane component [Paenibacillus sp. JDR-2]
MSNSFRKSKEDIIVDTLVWAISLIVLAATFYPLYFVLIQSFNDGADAAKAPIYWLPRVFSLENYQLVFKQDLLLTGLKNTLIRTVVGTAATIFVTSMAAYALQRPHLKLRKMYVSMGAVSMYFSGGLIPLYLVLNSLHLLDTFWVYIVPYLFGFFNCLLFMSFFRNIPEALVESALIDGASEFKIYWKIIIPLSTPVFATVSLFVAVFHWNDYFISSFFITKESLQTLPVILMRLLSLSQAQQEIQRYLGNNSSSVTLESMRYATLIISIAPITILYPFLQRFFVKGMLVGAIKA